MLEIKSVSEDVLGKLQIRRATIEDLPALVNFAVKLIRQHQTYDADRFTAVEPLEDEYAKFFPEQLKNKQAVILVGALEKQITGYAFLKIEDESFLDVRAATVWLHDIYIDESARGAKLGMQLLAAAVEAARDLGSSSLMLSVSPKNETANKLFKAYGFRPTMTEMRLDF
jgi:GNAT superfamily N-acetyltransferase